MTSFHNAVKQDLYKTVDFLMLQHRPDFSVADLEMHVNDIALDLPRDGEQQGPNVTLLSRGRPHCTQQPVNKALLSASVFWRLVQTSMPGTIK